MIIWGIKSKLLNGDHIQDIQCPGCGKRDFSSYGILKNIHIFWIPLFVFSKKVTVQCSSCSLTLTKKELSGDHFKSIRKSIFRPGKTIPRNFGILAIGSVALLFLILVISSF